MYWIPKDQVDLFINNEIIDPVAKKRKENEIKNDKDISLIEKSNTYKPVTCINAKPNRIISYPSHFIPLVTKVVTKQTQVQSITQVFKRSKTMVKKHNTSIDSNNLFDKKHCHVSPKRIDQKPATCFFFAMDFSLYVNDELETSTNQLKDSTSKSNSSKSGTRIKTGTHFINTNRTIETITSLVTQASSNTKLQNYDVPGFINNPLKQKSLPNEQVTNPTDSKSNPRPLLTSTPIIVSYTSKNISSIDIDGAKVGRTFNEIKMITITESLLII